MHIQRCTVVLFLITLKSVPLGVFAVCSVPCPPMGNKKKEILFRRYRENVGVSKMLNLFNSLWLKSTSSPAFSMLSQVVKNEKRNNCVVEQKTRKLCIGCFFQKNWKWIQIHLWTRDWTSFMVLNYPNK